MEGNTAGNKRTESSQSLVRARTVVYADGQGKYNVVCFKPFVKVTLDSIGLWTWFLFDDEATYDQVVDKILLQYPDTFRYQAEFLINDLIETKLVCESSSPSKIVELSSSKLSSSKLDHADKRAIPNLNVCFSRFPEFDYERSYLVWLLWHIAESISIVDDPNEAELIFHLDVIDFTSSDNSIDILVSERPNKDQIAKSAYVISTREAPDYSSDHLKWLRLPQGAIETRGSLAKKTALDIGEGFGIDRLVHRFQNFLIGLESDEKTIEPDSQSPLLSIGMATYDDYDGVYFSITSLQLHHPEVFEKCEVVILDNNPDGPAAHALIHLANINSNVRYVPYTDKKSTAIRDVLFHLASAPWVLCMDSHVLFPPKTLDRLLAYINENSASNDLLQGPLLDDSGMPLGSHFVAEWRAGMYGYWGWDDRAKDAEGEAFEIEMQGLGVFACRKNAWPGFNVLFNGFGGEEGYIHEKIRQNGGRCLCLPFLRWSHRFARPHGAKYALAWRDRIRNYFIGFTEIEYSVDQIELHFTELLDQQVVNEACIEAERLSHSPFSKFDHIACINLDSQPDRWESMIKRFEQLGIRSRVKRVSAIHTPEFHHIGCALSHRKIIEQAKCFGYKNILVFEDDALALAGAELFLSFALEELEGKPWKILYLGGTCDERELDRIEDCNYLLEVPIGKLTCCHALVYHHSVYDEILERLPRDENEMGQWIAEHAALDQELLHLDSRYLVVPKLFTQPDLRKLENKRYRAFYQ